jgi:hypothetical protein
MEARRTNMNTKNSLIALGVALALNAAALTGLNAAMTDGAQRAQLAQTEPARLVIVAKKVPTDQASTAKENRGGRRS